MRLTRFALRSSGFARTCGAPLRASLPRCARADDHFLRCRLTSRTAGFEPVNGGANPPAAAIRGLGLRSVVVFLAGRNSGGCDTRRLHHFPRVVSFNREAAGS